MSSHLCFYPQGLLQCSYLHPSHPYLALVLPILEYASVTLHSLNTILSLLNIVTYFSWYLSHGDFLSKSDLPLLSKLRDYGTLCHLYKILHHLSSSSNLYNPHSQPSFRNVNSRAITPPFCRQTLCHKSFNSYVPILWNYFPKYIVTLSNVFLQSFKGLSPPYPS